MEPCSYELYEFVGVVDLGFGKFAVLRSGVGSGNDGSFHKVSSQGVRRVPA
jgi:hypothetical protein